MADWADTRDTLQLWTQMVGKLRMALTPKLNHWWNVALYVAFLRATFAAGAETGDWPQVVAGGDGRVAAADPEVLS